MKKFCKILVTIAIWIMFLYNDKISSCAEPFNTSEKIISETSEYFDNGTFISITVTEEVTVTPHASTYTKIGAKRYSYCTDDGVELWSFTLHGTFTVNSGVSAVCTADSYSIDISDTSWQNDSAASCHDGNQAIGDASFVHKILLITTDTASCHVVLTCDSDGNLS